MQLGGRKKYIFSDRNLERFENNGKGNNQSEVFHPEKDERGKNWRPNLYVRGGKGEEELATGQRLSDCSRGT